MRHRIFLPLFLVLSATAFSASAMAASDTKAPPPANSKNAGGFPPFPAALIHQNEEWCKKYPPTVMRPDFYCQVCQC
ncbi:hypothetical protein GPM59_003233 [Salmonella enterica]|nr:hypothetical protein [Salmonella enterica]EDZ0487011.1 hypothetical protein [Salmonella enterica]